MGQFISWFLKNGKTKSHSVMDLAKVLSGILPKDRDITEGTVRMYVSNARNVLETKKGMTIWNTPGEGYRLATEKEKALFLVRSTKRTLKMAQRSTRLYAITDKRLIPDAVKQVYGSRRDAHLLVGDYSKQLLAITDNRGSANGK